MGIANNNAVACGKCIVPTSVQPPRPLATRNTLPVRLSVRFGQARRRTDERRKHSSYKLFGVCGCWSTSSYLARCYLYGGRGGKQIPLTVVHLGRTYELSTVEYRRKLSFTST